MLAEPSRKFMLECGFLLLPKMLVMKKARTGKWECFYLCKAAMKILVTKKMHLTALEASLRWIPEAVCREG